MGDVLVGFAFPKGVTSWGKEDWLEEKRPGNRCLKWPK